MDRKVAKEFLHIRDWLIHQYDEIDRALTWETLTSDLASWRAALSGYFADAEASLDPGT